MRRFAVPCALAGCLLAVLLAAGPAAAAGPEWALRVVPSADYFRPVNSPGQDNVGVYKVEAENVGSAATSGEVTLQDVLPAGLVAKEVRFYDPDQKGFEGVDLHETLCSGLLQCSFPGALSGSGTTSLQPGQRLVMLDLVEVPQGVEGRLEDVARISGGGAPPGVVEASGVNEASAEPPFGKLGFDAALADSSGNPYTEAGGHPYQLTTDFKFATYSAAMFPSGEWEIKGTAPVAEPRDVGSDLPPGLIVNPQAIPRCSLADFFSQECDEAKVAVGTAGLKLARWTNGAVSSFSPVLNLQPQGAYPGELGIPVSRIPVAIITSGLRSGSDYGIKATSVVAEDKVTRIDLQLWGVPADESHNPLRGKECISESENTPTFFESVASLERMCGEFGDGRGHPPGGVPAGVPPTPFITMPTQCSGQPLTIVGRYDSWQLPGQFAERSAEFSPVSGCNQLHFEPTIEARPTTNLADAPSGFEFKLKVPQNHAGPEGKEDPNGLATADLKEAVVTLPAGLTVNPSSANGLEGCSPAQIGLNTPVGSTPAHFSEAPNQCPDASKLGSVEVKTQLLNSPLEGSVFLATPHQNPAGALLAGYIVLEGQGLIIKLAGQFQTDPETGQITASFLENPQTPFEEFKFHFFEGAQGALRTPAVCGEYETTSVLTPYSYPESGPRYEKATSTFETTEGPAGEGSFCPSASPAEEPNAPVFHAGTENTQAGAFSPFAFRLVREDGSQEISKVDTTLPPGLVGKLAGIGECSDAQLTVATAREHEGGGAEEQASPSCPSSSEVGTVDVGAGAGPTPLYVQGHAYLAGPYKGAPLSLTIITPAVAGPFDLGTVVVRTALYVNPETAQIHAVSDEIPHILQGIPLDVKSITLKMSRPNFTLNPTNCNELLFAGSTTSVLGASAPLLFPEGKAPRFQVGGCRTLPFNPKLKLSLKGSTKRAGHPALKAVLTMKPGSANIAKAQVTLPHAEFLDNAHIQNVCTRTQFAAAGCPPSSVLGFARAETPLLDHPLEGPVYLMSGFGHKLPDVAADLNGQIRVLLHGKVDTGPGGGIRNTFEVVPDAPVSRFTLSLKGGRRGLIQNSESLCAKPQRATAIFSGQNGKLSDTEPVLGVKCPKQGKGHGKRHHRRAG